MNTIKKNILIIDDDIKLSELLIRFLEDRGYRAIAAQDGQSGLKKIKFINADLIILDIMMPGEDGFEILKKIRETSTIPVIMLTARGDITDRVSGLRLGADDYVPKPFEPAEIEARIEAVLRRTSNIHENIQLADTIQFPLFTFNRNKRTVSSNGSEKDLSHSEFLLLEYFITNKDHVVSREQILEKIRGEDFESFNRSVDILVSRLRKKLGDDGKDPSVIKTVHGHGYMFIGKDQN